MGEKKKIFVVYQKQRWDIVNLIKGYTNKEEAEKLRKDLKEKEDRYEEVYRMEEIEVIDDLNLITFLQDSINILEENIEITEKEIDQQKVSFIFHYLNGKKDAFESILEYIITIKKIEKN